MESRKKLLTKAPKLDPQLAFDVRRLSIYIPILLVFWFIAGNWMHQALALPTALYLTYRVYKLNQWLERNYPPGYLREWLSWMAGPDRLIPGTPPKLPPLVLDKEKKED